jgi:GNAT superfamily N-acetyltransferase
MADERLTRAHRGLGDALIHLARHARGGESVETDGVLLFAGEHPYPGAYCNGVLPFAASAETALRQARGFFGKRRRGFVVWTRPGIDDELERQCREANWTERPPPDGMPVLVLAHPLSRARDDEPPTSRIVTETEARSYLGLVAAAYDLGSAPFEMQRAVLFSPEAVTAAGAIGVLAHRQGEPAAGAMAIVRDGVACILWIATAPEARGEGLAGAALRTLVDAVRAEGASLACMQSSQQGLPRWTAMGFEQIGSYRRFLAPPAIKH